MMLPSIGTYGEILFGTPSSANALEFARLRVRMSLGELKLVAVGIADPGAQAHAVGPLFEWADKRNPLLFQYEAEFAQIARINANVDVRGHYLSRCSLTGVLNQF